MKYISLTKGKVAIVDDEDFEWLNQWKWCVNKERNKYYAVRSIWRNGSSQSIRMHRIITNAPKGMEIDHHNGDGLDNRRHNLRICTTAQNQHNQSKRKGLTSWYKGVSWNRGQNKWQTKIKCNGKMFSMGEFINEVDAAKAYDVKAKELFGEFAYLNFPPERKE